MAASGAHLYTRWIPRNLRSTHFPPRAMVQGNKPYFVGIDVGGTNIKFGLVDDDGQTLAYHSMRTEQDRGAEDACARMAVAVEQLGKKAGVERRGIIRAGLGTPGAMGISKGLILRPG